MAYLGNHPELVRKGVCPLLDDGQTVGGDAAKNRSAGADAVQRPPNRSSDVSVIHESPLFDPVWYRASYPELSGGDRDLAEHYLLHGAKLLRNPGPDFSTRFYVQKYPDVQKTGINPLLHYEKFGRAEGRDILAAYLDRPDSDPAVLASIRGDRGAWTDVAAATRYASRRLNAKAAGEPLRLFRSFDDAQTRRFISALQFRAESDRSEEELVSVIMPTYNRASKIGAAINSVLRQSWRNFELLVIDDGSTDSTSEILGTIGDSRMRVLQTDHGGVSVARNEGLRQARGSVIFYLDSDNQWTRDYLWVMMQSLNLSGAACGYAGTRLQTPAGHLLGYRGEPFDWESCLALNYVDMNVFCHRRELSDQLGMFDTGLRRMVDWDLILRFTRERPVFYAPFIGCIYSEDGTDAGRITTSQPIVSRRLVHDKNALGCTLTEAAAQLRFNISIKIFAPYEDRNAWGDYHYAESLAEALQRLGHRVRIDFRGQWYARPAAVDDIAIVLRGLEEYRPQPTQISLFWGISHPDTVRLEEYEQYQGVFVASRSFAELLEILLRRPVFTMWQCTDENRFFPRPEADPEKRATSNEGIFIGNSRREFRPIVRWAVEAELPVGVIGGDWEPYLPKHMIRATNAPNKELAALYGSAAFVLNDHWDSMRDFGYISNRVFDVLAAGGRLISDRLASLEALFGDAVISVSSAEELAEAVSKSEAKRSEAERIQLSEAVRRSHGFAQRSATFDSWIRNYVAPGLKAPSEAASTGLADRWAERPVVGVVASWSHPELPDRAIERLVAPFTGERTAPRLKVICLESAEDVAAADVAALVLAADCCTWEAGLVDVIAARMAAGLPVFLDTIGAEAPTSLSGLAPGLEGLWCGRESALPRRPPKCASVVRTRLDPRLWRLYRAPRPIEVEPDLLRLLVVRGIADSQALSDRAALSRLLELDWADVAISVRAIGADSDSSRPASNMKSDPWPDGCRGYARRARWLLDHVHSDIGIVFGTDEDSDAQVLRMMALGLVPAIIGPPLTSIARESGLSELVISCEVIEELPDALRRIARRPSELAARRRENLEHLWKHYSTLDFPDPRVTAVEQAVLRQSQVARETA
jgi:glycosyltransferase involved in cell wall biosynthesis